MATSPRNPDADFMIVPPRLGRVVDRETLDIVLATRDWKRRKDAALDWFVTDSDRAVDEIASTNARIERERAADLHDCVRSVAERFANAIAAGTEVALWADARTTEQPYTLTGAALIEVSQRAMVSTFAYFLLSTGHNLAAVVLRCMAMESGVRPEMLAQLGTNCPPHSTKQGDEWPSLNKTTCKRMRRVARKSNHDSVRELVELLSAIARHPAWNRTEDVRGIDYHRMRPASAPQAGATPGPVWTISGRTRSMGPARPLFLEEERRAADDTALLLELEELLTAELPRIREKLLEAQQDVGAGEAARPRLGAPPVGLLERVRRAALRASWPLRRRLTGRGPGR